MGAFAIALTDFKTSFGRDLELALATADAAVLTGGDEEAGGAALVVFVAFAATETDALVAGLTGL